MRVLFADCIKSEIGGGHFVLARLANYFAKHSDYGIQPIVLLNDVQKFKERFIGKEIKYIPFELGSSILSFNRGQGPVSFLKGLISLCYNLFPLWFRLGKILKEHKIDVVHANSMTSFFVLSFPAKFCNVKLIYHLHDTLLSPDEGGTMSYTIQGLLLFWMKAFADYIVANSKFVGKTITSKRPPLEKKVRILHNGLDLARIRQPHPKVYSGSVPLLVAFGRLDSRKGFDVAIKAVAVLRNKYGCQVKLRIIGDGPIRCELQDLVEIEKLNGQVELTGFKDNVYEYIAKGHIVVIPSVWEEPFGLAVIEAMANSKIIIASKVGGIPEMLREGEEGFLVPKAEPEAIAEKVIWVMEHPDKANAMAARAYHRVSREFTIVRMASQLVNIYQSLLERNK